MEKKLLIFDMDGVLFNSIGYAREVFLKGHPGMTVDMYNEMHTGSFPEEIKKYSHLQKLETVEEKNKRITEYTKNKSMTPLFSGIYDFINELHNIGFLLAVNTNAYDRNCLPLLENSGIKSKFDFIASRDLSISKVEKFKLIEEKYKIEKKNILFITDALGDIRDADIAGIPTIAVTWGVHNRKFFEREKHLNLIIIVDTVKELLDYIKKY